MKKNYFSIIASLGLFTVTCFADSCPPGCVPESNEINERNATDLFPGNPIVKDQLPVGYLYPGEYKIKSREPTVFTAEFLYWTFNRVIGDLALRTAGDGFSQEVLVHKAGYRPGFRVTMGFAMPDWDDYYFNATWGWYHHQTTTRDTAAPGEAIVPLGGALGATFPVPSTSKLESKLRCHLDWVDLALVKSFYIGKRLMLDPYFGLKAIFSEQRDLVNFEGIGRINSRFHFWALGPLIGMNLKGLTWWGFYLAGKAAFAIPYLRQTLRKTVVDFPGVFENIIKDGRHKPYLVQPFIETNIGLGWGDYFNCNRYHIDFRITYDYMMSWIISVAETASYVPQDIYLHGWTFRAQLDF